jgi:antirestriction protein ArdC
MAQHSIRERATQPKPSLYEEITSRIIAELEAGVFPWARPWGAGGGSHQAFALPQNAATGKSYSGINILILWGRVFECGYALQHWLTFRQAASLGGTVRKGEHGVTVCYADRFIPKREQGGAITPDRSEAENQETAIPLLRRYTVFNVDQCDNLPEHCRAHVGGLPEREIVPQAEALAAATRAEHRRSIAQWTIPSTSRRSPLSSSRSITTGPYSMSLATGPAIRAA